jgi:hypothetical protein
MPKNAFAKSQNRLDDPVPVAGVYGPTTGLPPETWYDKAEQLSYGLGAGAVSQLEGYKQLLTHPVQSVREMAAGMLAAAKDPSLVANALSGMWGRATANPEGFGSVVGENLNPRNLLRNMTWPTVRELTTYHGTPHRFPATDRNPLGEFDASKIGTGEGAQAYGHGIYVAESPGVAKSYKDKLTPSAIVPNAAADSLEKMNPDLYARLEKLAKESGYSNAAINRMVVKPNEFREIDAALKREILDFKKGAKGSLYHVDLPDEMIDRMLDWDKPLSKQPKAAQLAIEQFKKLYPDESDWLGIDRHDLRVGADLIKPLGGLVGDKKASEMLRQAGIPGVRYLDAGSRDGAKNTRNFVVFPGEEQNLKILKRE